MAVMAVAPYGHLSGVVPAPFLSVASSGIGRSAEASTTSSSSSSPHFVRCLALASFGTVAWRRHRSGWARGTPVALRRADDLSSSGVPAGGVTLKTEDERSRTLRRAKRFAVASVAVAVGLVLLLYTTSFVEGAMHKLFAPPMNAKTPAIAMMIGLAVGGLHTVAGPDHLAALAPLVIGQRRSIFAAFGLGALWGSGHATGQLVIGLGCLAVHLGLLQMHVATALQQMSGVLVGLSLIAIGLLGFKEAKDYDPTEDEETSTGRFGWATYATGVVHGLSLDAIIFILPAFSLPRFSAIVHVIGVVTGTLFSMGCYTTVLSLFFRKSPRLKLVSASASSISLLLGCCIMMSCFGIAIPLPGL